MTLRLSPASRGPGGELVGDRLQRHRGGGSRDRPARSGCRRRRPRAAAVSSGIWPSSGTVGAQWPGQRLGHRLPAAGAEHLHPRAVGQLQPGHVLDHADHPLVGLQRDRARPARPPRPRPAAAWSRPGSRRSGTSWATEIAMSPVPGGRSSSSTSRSPQNTSARNCCSARCSIGPRQTTAALPGVNMPIEMTFTPCACGGMIMSSTWVGRCRSRRASAAPSGRRCRRRPRRPTARGRPSPRRGSRSPTDLPTPPLPDATAYTRVSEPGWANGITGSAASPRSLRRSSAALLVAHHVQLDPHRADTRAPPRPPR